METDRIFRITLQNFLADNGLTHEEFAAKIPVNKSTVGDWLAGRGGISPTNYKIVMAIIEPSMPPALRVEHNLDVELNIVRLNKTVYQLNSENIKKLKNFAIKLLKDQNLG